MKLPSYFTLLRPLLLVVFSLLAGHCQTPAGSASRGLEPGFEAYIPARIAIVPCSIWPGPPIQAQVQKLGDFSSEMLCRRFDKFVAEGFDRQPYMSGLAPELVQELAAVAQQGHWQREAMAIWQRILQGCSEEGGAADLYQRCLASASEWELWLAAFGKTTHHSDALLLPFIVEVTEQYRDDRGILLSSRTLKLVQLLIATDTATLIWSGNAEAIAVNKRPVPFKGKNHVLNQADYPAYPEWLLLHQRIFTPNFWKDFPGRLTLPGE